MSKLGDLFGGSKPPKPKAPPAPRPEQDVAQAIQAFRNQNPAEQRSGRELFMADLMFDETTSSGLQTAQR